MPRKDGVVAIGFDYREELNKVVGEISKEIDKLGENSKLGKNLSAQLSEVKNVISSFKNEMNDSISSMMGKKVNTSTFNAFKKETEASFKAVDKVIVDVASTVDQLQAQVNILGDSNSMSGILSQFQQLREYVDNSLSSISKLVEACGNLGISPVIDKVDSSVEKKIKEINELRNSTYTIEHNKGEDKAFVDEFNEIKREAQELAAELSKIKIDPGNMIDLADFTAKQQQLKQYIDALRSAEAYVDDMELDIDGFDFLGKNFYSKLENQTSSLEENIKRIHSLTNQTNASSSTKEHEKDILHLVDIASKGIKIDVRISTKDSTLAKRLEETIGKLQEKAIANPIITPVKLRVDSEYANSQSGSRTTTNQVKEAQKALLNSDESVYIDLDKTFANSMKVAVKNAISMADEAINEVKKRFETKPVLVHLDIPEEEKEKLSSSIVGDNKNKTLNISGEIKKARTELQGLYEDFNKFINTNSLNNWLDGFSTKVNSELSKIKQNKSLNNNVFRVDESHINSILEKLTTISNVIGDLGNRNLQLNGMQELVDNISKAIVGFNSIKDIIVSIQNLESTVARAGGVTSKTDISAQWNIAEQSLDRITKKDGDIKKNQLSHINEIALAYQKYVNMGGTNPLESLGKSADTINRIKAALSEIDTKPKVETSSMQKDFVEELNAIQNLIDKIEQLVNLTKEIKPINIAGDLNKLKNVESLKNIDAKKLGTLKTLLDDIAVSLERINKFKNATAVFQNLKLTKGNVENFNKFKDALNKIRQSLSDVSTSSGKNNFLNQISSIVKHADALKSLASILKESKKKIEEVSNATANTSTPEVKKEEKDKTINVVAEQQKLEKSTKDLAHAYGQINKGNNIVQNLDKITNAYSKQQQALENLKLAKEQGVIDDSEYDRLIKSINVKDISVNNTGVFAIKSELESLKEFSGESSKYSSVVSDNLSKIERYISLMEKAKSGNLVDEGEIAELQSLGQQLPGVVSQVKELRGLTGEHRAAKLTDFTSVSQIEQYVKGLQGIDTQSIKIANNGNKITATYKNVNKQLETLVFNWNSQLGAYTQSTAVLKQHLTIWDRLGNTIKASWHHFKQYFSGYMVTQRIITELRKGIDVIKQLDLEYTEMRKVSDESIERLKAYQRESFNTADKIASTAVGIQSSTSDFMRLGYNLGDSEELAIDANIYANVGDMDIDTATEHMVSSIKAWGSEFESEVEASGAIVDKYNEIGNNFAITSADIGSAMERSAAALKAGGNTLDESLGLITAGNLIQQDADTTANALKVVSLRIRGSKTELDAMGESTDDLSTSTSKLREEIKGLTGVDIMIDEDTYKSTAQIIGFS